MEISDIYAPVGDQLLKVQDKLKTIGDVDFSHLAELINYSLTNTGKMIRPVLTFLSGSFYEYEKNLDTIVLMASAIEIMHIATLVHDDAIDHSDVRRGRTTIYKLYGEEQAVLLGDYLFAKSGCMAADTGNLRVIRKFSDTLRIISHGEIDQAHNSYSLNQNRENYFRRISQKTAALFQLSTESGSVLSKAPDRAIDALHQYAYDLGVGFQIVDDILDFAGTAEQLGKPVGSDLTQGTLTLPSFMLMEKYPQDNPVRRLFENKGIDGQDDVDRAIDMVKNSTIIKECYNVAQEFCDKAVDDLKVLPDVESKECLAELAGYIMRRNK